MRVLAAVQRFMSLLLKVWRGACQHIEIHESTSRIAPLLRKHLPVDLVLVRRIDLERSCVDTVGIGASNSSPHPKGTRTTLSAEDLERLLAWCQRGKVLRIPRDEGPIAPELIAPEGVGGQILVGPLCGRDGPSGLLLLVVYPPRSFSDLHEEVAKALVEPFSVALENDGELRAMRTHQEAAEADRHSLLTKLGRQEISEAIVGAESGLRTVMERVQLVARSDVPVLLLGETGSGK